jgi:ribosome-associated translation inhibitor RaiA
MTTALRITFRHMDTSPAMESDVRAALDRLEAHCDRIVSCHVVIEAPHKHHRRGRRFHIRIELTVPGRDIVIAHAHEDRVSHQDAHVALRDAFHAARRALDAHLESLWASHGAA